MFAKFTQFLLHIFFLIARPVTLGVRGICCNLDNNNILLVKHTYSKDWALPGGGVEVGESIEKALQREFKEEVGFDCVDVSVLDTYYNFTVSKRDHVIIYLINSWKKIEKHDQPKYEISHSNWFALNNLPENMTPCTRYALEQYRVKFNI